MSPRALIFTAFILSGMAGLAYEVVWTRYLGLYVGHGEYAQVLVLAVYLGGMALGALIAGDLSRRSRRPLLWYAAAEALLAAAAFAFHPLFTLVTELSYGVVFPALDSAPMVGAARWGAAGLLILPQAVILGTTFPLMAAGLARSDIPHAGRGVADAYLFNTVGGASGVLLAGFVLIGSLGLPGAMMAAGAMSGTAALLAWVGGRGTAPPVPDRVGTDVRSSAPSAEPGSLLPGGYDPVGLWRVLLGVSLATAVASFAYEIGWIRMLSLVLGSATHSFELMLSAFILGLALGAWIIRRTVDTAADPIRLLGGIQLLMGLAAVASIPLYMLSFEAVAWMVSVLPADDSGYRLFNLGRYGLSLAIMLPATALAGMTLPLITGILLRAGHGERAIGWVYGWNTVGSVLGVGLSGLVLLPWLGLKGLLVAGAALDMTLGLWLVALSARARGRGARAPALAAGAALLVLTGVLVAVPMDRGLLTSGVFRSGRLPAEGDREVLYHEDGRTATVSAWLGTVDGLVVLSTNGKPDASLGPRWLIPGAETRPPAPMPAGRDFTTQVLAPMVGLAHHPRARTVANIGHGSGLTGTALLTSPRVERLVNIEIEPRMVEGSFVFLPVNEPVFRDVRSTFVFDDARSFFAHNGERFDLIFAEPSNPWVSGTASLFTGEFYRHLRSYMAEDGILTQWIQLYEINDDLFLSVLAALDAAFPRYRGYLVGTGDLVVVAGGEAATLSPDWSVLRWPGFRDMTPGTPPFMAAHLEALYVFDETTFRPVLDGQRIRANSDFYPTLDLGADRARFLQQFAHGLFSFVSNRLDLHRSYLGIIQEPLPYEPIPALGLEPLESRTRAAWMREALDAGGAAAPPGMEAWGDRLVQLGDFLAMASQPPVNTLEWLAWARIFDRAERSLHWGTAGWADSTFYDAAFRALEAGDPPREARAAVELMHGAARWDWAEAAAATEVLLEPVAAGEGWVRPSVLLDVAVLAYLKTGRPAMARRAYTLLADATGRDSSNLRNRLLERLIEMEEARAAPDGGSGDP